MLKGLPENLLIQFNRMNATAKQYTLNRICGFNKVDSLRNAGSQAKTGASLSSTAQSLEERNPQINEIIEYAQQHDFEKNLLSDESTFAKTTEQKELEAKEKQLNYASQVMTPDMAESVNFYRRVANGSVKKYKTIEKYDANGKLLFRTREITDDPSARMQAREKLDRMLGLNAIQSLGQVQVGSISINIVDASKPKDDEQEVDFQHDAIVKDEDGNDVIDEGTEIEIENEKDVTIEKPQKISKKEEKEQFNKAFDETYAKILEKRAKKAQRK